MERSVLILTYDDIRNANRADKPAGGDAEWLSKFAYYVEGTQLPPGAVKAVIIHPDDPQYGRMSCCVDEEGFRILKQRCGKLPPPDEFPKVKKQPSSRSASNPEGLYQIVVRRKIHLHGEWHPVAGWAMWDEMVPLTRWRRGPDGTRSEIEPYLDAVRFPHWAEKPITSLTRCAEMDAMRKAWPTVFGDLHRPEELDWMLAETEAETALAA